MSEKLGTVGKEYVNRKTGRQGFFLSQDDEKKVVKLVNGNLPFTVSFATFKSMWREVTMDEVEPNNEAESNDEEIFCKECVIDYGQESEQESKQKSASDSTVVYDRMEFDTDEDKLNYYKDRITKFRDDVEFEELPDIFKIRVEDILVFEAIKLGQILEMRMLPDVFTYSALPGRDDMEVSFDFDTSDKMSVKIVTQRSLGDILEFIVDAVIMVNLYGYKFE